MKTRSLIAALLILSALISCACSDTSEVADGEQSGTSDTAAAETDILDTLPAQDYDGYEFTFYTRNCCNGAHKNGLYIAEESADVVETAVFTRNLAVEERYNIKITEPLTADDGEPTALTAALLADDKICDSIVWHFKFCGDLGAAGLLYDMKSCDYLQFDQPWWATELIEHYSILGKQFVALGEVTTDSITQLGCLYFNKNIVENTLNNADLYGGVRDGSWTIDKLIEYAAAAGNDVNGDGIEDPSVDTFGFLAYDGYLVNFMYGSDHYVTELDSEGIPQLCLMDDKMSDIVNKVYTLVCDTPFCEVSEGGYGTYFANGNALFYASTFFDATQSTLRDMKDSFGVLPFPKYDENQEKYYMSYSLHSSLIAMPYNVDEPDRAAFILEALCEKGYDVIYPALMDTAFKTKLMRDEDSCEMMDIIIAGRTSDFAAIFDGWLYSSMLTIMVGRNHSTGLASYYQSNLNYVQGLLDTAVEAFRNAG